MKNLIPIVVTLFLTSLTLTLVIYGEEYKYGDIIAFPRKNICGVQPVTYKHYAIYIGSKRFEEQAPNQDIFHLTGSIKNIIPPRTPLSDCVYGKLADEGENERDNYLDEIWGKEINLPGITKRIKEKYNNCGPWNPKKNNCEHIATYVRYGLKISLQCGTSAAKVVSNPEISEEMFAEIKKRISVPTCEELCSSSPGDKSG
ncbi:hypothetical protein CHARACLAT_028258 [Characodon lateralis]|uniref:LRAT domain-containing protein n=1 Tax=Characodon lateralis TaxID=208331 RepID=A0ABU7DNJ8_9TELE|nr:hypothetical protein [Characodon lateralis]